MAPVYGHVSFVSMGADADAQHFMHDIEKDMSEGQMRMVEESRKGPFKDQTGRSRILHSTANTVYRRRGEAKRQTGRGRSPPRQA